MASRRNSHLSSTESKSTECSRKLLSALERRPSRPGWLSGLSSAENSPLGPLHPPFSHWSSFPLIRDAKINRESFFRLQEYELMMAKQGVNNASVSLQHGVCPGFGTRVDCRVRLGGKLESGILAVLPSCGSSGAVRAITVTFAIIPGRSQQRDLGTQHHTQPVPRRGMWKETQLPLKTPLTWQKRIVLLSAFLAVGEPEF